MSASDKKQQRKAQLADGLTQRQQKEQTEVAAAKKKKTIYTVVGVVCAAAAVALLVWNNAGSFRYGAAAATVDGVEYKVSDLQYYYVSARNYSNYLYSMYGASFGYDATINDGAQWANEAEGQTYADSFRESALNSLKQTAALCAAAKEEGYTLSEAGQKQIDDQLAQIDAVCAQNGLTRSGYFAQVYGKGVTEKVFLRNLTNDTLASEYANYHQENISYEDDALQAYYEENPDSLDSYDYRVFPIDGTALSTTDAEGNSVDPTDEEKAQAMADAKEKADQAVAEIEAADDREQAFIDAAPKYVADTVKDAYAEAGYSLQEEVRGVDLSRSSASISQWLMDSARKKDDVTAIETTTGYQVVLFLDRYLVEDPTVDIRHILIRAETSDDAATNTQGVKIPTQEQMDAAKAEVQTILDQWNAMSDEEKTPEAFGKLAEEHSDDGGSNTKGGKYQYVYKGQMVANFDAWIFDSSRKPGDVGMVENSGDDATYYGWHLIYFEKEEEPYWKGAAIEAKQQNDHSEWLTALTDATTAEVADGMQYVGEPNTAQPTPSATPAGSAEPQSSESPAESGEPQPSESPAA